MNFDSLRLISVSGILGAGAGFLLRHLWRPASNGQKRAQACGVEDALRLGAAPSPTQTGQGTVGVESDTGSATSFMLGIVDVIDQIDLSKRHVGADCEPALSAVQALLRDQIELADGEVIHETVWTPALQRAVAVEAAEPGQNEVKCLRSLARGLKYRARIMRKQEVAISQPRSIPQS